MELKSFPSSLFTATRFHIVAQGRDAVAHPGTLNEKTTYAEGVSQIVGPVNFV